MSPQAMLMVAANVFFVAGGLLLGLAFALKYRNTTRARMARIEEFYNTFERPMQQRLAA